MIEREKMKKIILLWMSLCLCFGALGENKVWKRGYTFLNFLEDHSIPLKLYYDLPSQDKELTAEIYAGIEYQTLKDKNGVLLQALIPIGDDIQLHIYRENFQYKITFTPIKFFEKKHILALRVNSSPYQDIFSLSKDLGLSNEFLNTYKNSINFKRDVNKGDRLVLFYTRKYRFGQYFSNPVIQASMIETNKKPNYLIAYNDGRFYDLKGRETAGFLLQMPLSYVYITSKFTHARKHPVLKRIVRPHYGIDLRAKVGTPVKSAGNGRVVSAGKKGGYGNAIEIAHEGGLKTLYAHLSVIDKKVRVGKYVKQGQIIAKSGNTGISSGPHLHFGLYKNNRPINPLGSIRTTRSELRGKKKEEFLKIANEYEEAIQTELLKLNYQDENQTQSKFKENKSL